MNLSTRERILEAIGRMRTASVAELSQQLHTTVANIRYHLDPLLAGQIVEAIPPAPERTHRGRPATRYQLSAKARPDDLGGLASDLLAILLDAAQTPAGREQAIAAIARKRCAAAEIAGAATQRLNQAVGFLNRGAYQARWEAHRAGPEIRLGNCPFAPLLPAHPELCQIDRRMLEELLSARATILACHRTDSGFPPACAFALQFLHS